MEVQIVEYGDKLIWKRPFFFGRQRAKDSIKYTRFIQRIPEKGKRKGKRKY